MLPRLRNALLVSLGLGGAISPAFFSSGCGPEAIGVESCRKIEGARCEAAGSCGFSPEDVADCKIIYGDQCLHGIENKAYRPTEPDTEACVAAVRATGVCAGKGVKKMSGCPQAPLVAGAADESPCDIVLSLVHRLDACAFAAADPDAGAPASDAAADADAD